MVFSFRSSSPSAHAACDGFDGVFAQRRHVGWQWRCDFRPAGHVRLELRGRLLLERLLPDRLLLKLIRILLRRGVLWWRRGVDIHRRLVEWRQVGGRIDQRVAQVLFQLRVGIGCAGRFELSGSNRVRLFFANDDAAAELGAVVFERGLADGQVDAAIRRSQWVGVGRCGRGARGCARRVL
jgi:hypothetical protein